MEFACNRFFGVSMVPRSLRLYCPRMHFLLRNKKRRIVKGKKTLVNNSKWNSIYKTLFLIPFSFFTQLKLSTQSFTTYYQKSILSIVSNTITLILSLLDFLIAAMSSCQEEDSRRTKGLLGTIDGTIGSAVCRNKSKERVAPFTGPVFSRSP